MKATHKRLPSACTFWVPQKHLIARASAKARSLCLGFCFPCGSSPQDEKLVAQSSPRAVPRAIEIVKQQMPSSTACCPCGLRKAVVLFCRRIVRGALKLVKPGDCSQAYEAFTPDQRKVLRCHVAALHHAPINTLEHVGGGGVRCALGEIFT